MLISRQNSDQSTPCYPCAFLATYKTGTGPNKNGIEITFTEEPPQEVLDTLRANNFLYNRKRGVWYSIESSHSKQLAQQIVRRGLAPEPMPPEVIVQTLPSIEPNKAGDLAQISEKFHLPDGAKHNRVRMIVQNAFQSIEMVHDIDASFVSIPVQFIGASSEWDALFSSDKQGIPLLIEVSIKKDLRVLDVVHEIGHYLDVSLGKRIVRWREGLVDTIKRTEGYRAFRNYDFMGTTRVLITDENGTREEIRKLDDVDPGSIYRMYACDDTELFARGYEQYIAMKCGLLQSEVERDTRFGLQITKKGDETISHWNSVPILWGADDFWQVENLFDKLFHELGWKVDANFN